MNAIVESINTMQTQVELNSIKTTTVFPIYIGDYFAPSTALPSSVLRIGDYFYCADAKATYSSTTNYGRIRRFILRPTQVVDGETVAAANREDTDWAHEDLTGHANSMAYDPASGRIYIAPIWDQTKAEEDSGYVAKYLYVYGADFEYLPGQSEAYQDLTPENIMGVSYDHVAQSLYCFSYSHNLYRRLDTPTGEIVTIDGIDYPTYWELVCEVSFSNVPTSDYFGRSYNQDFAIYDSKFYISSPYGNILYGELEEGTSVISGSFNVSTMDSFCRFRMGELEGMEFGSDGRLYAIDYVSLTSSVINAFVVEIPIGSSPTGFTGMGGAPFSVHDGTLTLSSGTQAMFALQTYNIRSLAQLECMELSDNSSRVTIPEGSTVTDDFAIRVNKNISVRINGHYIVNQLAVYGGCLVLESANNTHILEFTTSSNAIKVNRAGSLRLSGEYPLRIKADNLPSSINNFIFPTYAYPITAIRIPPVSIDNPQKTLYIGGKKIGYSSGLFVGQSNIVNCQPGEEIRLSGGFIANGFLNDTGKTVYFTVPQLKNVPTGTTISVSSISGAVSFAGPDGWFGGSQNAEKASTSDTANFTFSAAIIGTGIIRIAVTKSTGFTKVVDGVSTPLTGPMPVTGLVTQDMFISFE